MSLASSASSDQVHVVTYHFRCADIARGSSQAFDQAMQSLKRHFAVGIQSHNDFDPDHS